MKFKNVNGVQHIILEPNDKIKLTTSVDSELKSINIECNNDGFNISGSSSLINTIRGDGMLEKVYIPPVISSEEIIEKCDKWLEMFRKIHDIFRELALTDKYKEQKVSMELTFYSYFSFSDKNIRGRMINLDLRQDGTKIKEGMTISVSEKNEAIYKYLIANVIDYYLSKNYDGTTIDIQNWNQILYSTGNAQDKLTRQVEAKVVNLSDSPNLMDIATKVIINHNLGQNSKQIINNLKNAICPQQLWDLFDEDIDYSARQYEYILADDSLDSSQTLKRKRPE